MEDVRNTINHTLVHLFNDILKVEEKALANGRFKELTMTDMHTIEAIGESDSINMTRLAKKIGITVGTLTIGINHLVKKGYAKRVRSEKDRRVVLISLTDKGRLAYRHHLDFHDRMISHIMQGLEEDELRVLQKALMKLDVFFTKEKKRL